MTVHLLDVNVVLALLDQTHEHHTVALQWFERVGRKGFATCPIVENGVLRIASSTAYPNRPGGVDVVRRVLASLCDRPRYVFWPDEISLLRPTSGAMSGVTSRQVTDVYLLALAAHHGERLATFDTSLPADAVQGGEAALVTLPF